MLDSQSQNVVSSSYDPFSDVALPYPYFGYEMLRKLGPAVFLPKYDLYALTRFTSVQHALKNDSIFLSGKGVSLNQKMNDVFHGDTLCSDGAAHDRARKVTAAPLTTVALKSMQEDFRLESEKLVGNLLGEKKGKFDAIRDLAHYLPVTIVSEAVGLPEEGREKMLIWSEALFNCMGPLNKRADEMGQTNAELMHYAATQAVRGKLKPGSWAEGIIDAADRGDVPAELVPMLMIDYMAPSLDTTISAIGSAIWLFGHNPEQWDMLRNDMSLMRNAINEILRIEAPLQCFSRYVAEDTEIDGAFIPKDSRVICFFGAGNRDPRQFDDPDRFDITRRNANTHLTFGHGPHQCIGMNLARMEMVALFTTLAEKVKRFNIVSEERLMHNTLRAFKTMDVEVELD